MSRVNDRIRVLTNARLGHQRMSASASLVTMASGNLTPSTSCRQYASPFMTELEIL